MLLVVALRSIVLPMKAIVMNLLSVGAAAFGVVVALFQWGWGAELLGFTSEGFIQAFVPLFLFSVLFGLSMDYEVFLMTRMREEWDRTGSNELAVARGLERTGRTVTSAALIMVVVFAAFTGEPPAGLQGHGIRAGRCRPDRRHGRPGGRGAGHDATARAAGTGGCRPMAGSDAAAPRGTGRVHKC